MPGRSGLYRSINSVFVAAWLVVSGLAQAKDFLPFDTSTWAHLLQTGQRPQAVVFTTSDCEYCPAVIDGLAQALQRHGSKTPLVVVVMDATKPGATVRSNPHYRRAGRLYAFVGEPEHLRYGIDPEWRGVTPYVVLIDRKGGQHRFVGMPPAGDLRRVLIP